MARRTTAITPLSPGALHWENQCAEASPNHLPMYGPRPVVGITATSSQFGSLLVIMKRWVRIPTHSADSMAAFSDIPIRLQRSRIPSVRSAVPAIFISLS